MIMVMMKDHFTYLFDLADLSFLIFPQLDSVTVNHFTCTLYSKLPGATSSFPAYLQLGDSRRLEV